MKTKKMQHWVSAAILGLSLSSSTSFATSDYIFNTYPNATASDEVGKWFKGWGGAAVTLTADSAMNGPQGPSTSSSAMKFEVVFDSINNPDNQFAYFHCTSENNWWDFGNASKALPSGSYDQFEYDVYFDPSCPTESGSGRIAGFEDVLTDVGYTEGGSLNTWTGYTSADTGKWIHVVRQIPGTFGAQISGVGFKIWSASGGSGLIGTTTFWVDNIKLRGKVGPIVLPTLGSPQKAASQGLWLGVPGPGGGGSRQGVYTATSTFPWYQVATPATPVSYSMTIADYPNIMPGFQTHMFIVGDAAQNTSAIDWNGNHVVFLRIMNNADGSAYANMWFKTNAPMAYSNMIYNASHQLVTNLNSATASGKWTVTFTGDADGSLTAPDGSITNFVFPTDAAAFFATPYVSFGIQGNNDNYVARGITLSKIEIKHPNGGLTDTFSAPPLDTAKWGIAAGAPTGVQVIPDGLWVNWSLPASGYDLLASATVDAPLHTWTSGLITNNPVAAPFNFANAGRIVVPWTSLPSTSNNYLRMAHAPVFTKLQVLMPGETSAPMTPLGKSGTPVAQKVGVPFTIRVNACDDYWQIVPATDTITITSSDTTVTLPADDVLVAGTKTFSVTFGSNGTATVTATDVSDGSKTANTGSTTQVDP
jgi:hypothetical protein